MSEEIKNLQAQVQVLSAEKQALEAHIQDMLKTNLTLRTQNIIGNKTLNAKILELNALGKAMEALQAENEKLKPKKVEDEVDAA